MKYKFYTLSRMYSDGDSLSALRCDMCTSFFTPHSNDALAIDSEAWTKVSSIWKFLKSTILLYQKCEDCDIHRVAFLQATHSSCFIMIIIGSFTVGLYQPNKMNRKFKHSNLQSQVINQWMYWVYTDPITRIPIVNALI